MSHDFTEDQIADLKASFNLFDIDRNGECANEGTV